VLNLRSFKGVFDAFEAGSDLVETVVEFGVENQDVLIDAFRQVGEVGVVNVVAAAAFAVPPVIVQGSTFHTPADVSLRMVTTYGLVGLD
jgi:hypothetical protein